MIIFRDDWLNFPNAIVDYKTKNESFLRISALYKEMGIENCLFPLALLQPELQGIDPHDENLSEDIKLKIGLEVTYNYWYFIREVAKVPPVAGPNAIPYKANRGNISLSWCFLNHIDFALIQPRQTGKSVSTDLLSIWVLYLKARNTMVNLITKDHSLRVKNVERLKKMRELLPDYLIHKQRKDGDNQIGLRYEAFKNFYETSVGQTSETGATKIGRGLTSPIFHVDEGPFIAYIEATLNAALGASTAAKEEAATTGNPYGNIFTTTAGKKDDPSGKYMYDLIHGGAVWNEVFFDAKNVKQLKEMISKSRSGIKTIINGTFSHRQLGKTDKWLYEVMADNNLRGAAADRDLFNVWTSGTLTSPLPPHINDMIKKSELDPLYNEISKDNYIIRWYIEKEKLSDFMSKNKVVLGLDTSDAIGRDSLAMVFINAKNLATIGAATINETNLLVFCHFLAEILVKYTNITLVIEKKSSAQTIIDALTLILPKYGINPFERMFNRIVDESSERPTTFKEISTPMNNRSLTFYDPYKKYFGFNTGKNSRMVLYHNVLENAAHTVGHLVRDMTLSNEIRSLVSKNGRIDHSSGGHDDMVIAWLMCHWFLTYSKNLWFYGIDSSVVMNQVKREGGDLTAEEELEVENQERLKEEIDVLFEKLTKTTDQYQIANYESKLSNLTKKIKIQNGNETSIDAMIKSANDERDRRNKKRAIELRSKSSTNGYNNNIRSSNRGYFQKETFEVF